MLAAIKPGGTGLVTVPVEIGPRGIAKLIAKLAYGYDLSELPQSRALQRRSATALLTGARVSRFRDRTARLGNPFRVRLSRRGRRPAAAWGAIRRLEQRDDAVLLHPQGSLRSPMKAYVRAVQTFFPMLQDARFRIQRTVQRATRSVHDPDWLAFKRLRVGDRIILDVGANRGLSIESFRIALPGRPIVAFEPNPRLAGKLEQEYGSSDNVRIEPVALSDAPGAAKLYLPRYRNYVFDSLASMERAEAMEWLGSGNFKGFDARHLTCLEMDITTRTLDTFGLAPSVIKLDTQGSEEKVLCGGLQTIASTRPIILLEGATPSIRELLMQFNYRAYVFDNGELIPDRMDARNVFFLTPERLRRTS